MAKSIYHVFVPPTFRPSAYIRNLVRHRTNCRVYSGPFKGLQWIPASEPNAEFDISKMLGIYERELGSCVERACGLNFSLIVDVGAAEGYYAVGLAVRNPAAKVVAYEMQPKVQAELVKKAKLNGVTQRVEICGKCEPKDLEQALTGTQRPFVICDTEGYEAELLDPEKVPSLVGAYILVELHEFAVRGITEKIKRWYAPTHKITHIWQEERRPADFPFSDLYTRFLPDSYRRWAVGESRPERMAWFWMEPINAVPSQKAP